MAVLFGGGSGSDFSDSVDLRCSLLRATALGGQMQHDEHVQQFMAEGQNYHKRERYSPKNRDELHWYKAWKAWYFSRRQKRFKEMS